ncbi:N-glycosylase/DNA lyase OGG1 isoform X2 [Amborella trichopoda]|uniref:N-glycosylase/DNA lyase OGG1 isoform X2 n=1 Tax=Amborella trichopoda TaxID=13333 RepID=UPI0009C17FAA|nr:N-glycosylase/DNA lyase OGG1 isoform X2 [Amborella trichopoda]|eukprot:XP_020530630.1 N-glycosylase/DNA lyase OGG1 isoform X2 [Amborella trichopoda]
MLRRRQTPIPPIQKLSKSSSSLPSSSKTRRPLLFLKPTVSSPDGEWKPLLNMGISELSLPLTFPTGQTFTWKQTASTQFTGVLNSHLLSLRQLQDGSISYLLHRTCFSSPSLSKDEAFAMDSLKDFMNLQVSLGELWAEFSEADSRFAELAPHMSGARVLRQDPLECLFQFLCSSNNNIPRITQMVSEEELRKAGFGYRAKYIVDAVAVLQSKPGGGAEWLLSLRTLELQEVTDALLGLPGVGPKVAACVALFSLDQHHAIPVDTHVWQIAKRYISPELEGATLTPKLSRHVAEAFVMKFGKYAGWAQTVLFIGELSSQKALLPVHLHCDKATEASSKKLVTSKNKRKSRA